MGEERILEPMFEKMRRTELREIQLKRLKEVVHRVYECVPFYYSKMKELNVSPDDIRSIEDVRKLPFTTKNDLRNNYPFKLSAVPLSEIVEIHASSGTTGTPTLGYYTENDLKNWGDLVGRAFKMAGVGKSDVVQITASLGMFSGGFAFYHGARRVGATIVPASAGYSRRQLQYMIDFGTTTVCAITSYMLRLAEIAKEMNIDPISNTSVRKGLLGSEAWSQQMWKRVCETWNMDAYDAYGLTELNGGPGVAADCQFHDGLHVWEDHYIVEVVDPNSGEHCELEEKGELVFTTLCKEAMPLLRYRTRDVSFLYASENCDCGRTLRRIGRIQGRTDDMIKVSGVNFWPSLIEEALLKHPEVGPEYQIIVDRVSEVDRLTIYIETKTIINEEEKKKVLSQTLRDELRELLLFTPNIEVVDPGQLPRVEVGKAKRVIDKRVSG
ncbi:MAG: phenylacetate--CoA ligase [Nitrososphaerales archaeon]